MTTTATVEDLQIDEHVPLVRIPEGVIRIKGTRIPIDTVVWAFDNGSTPEEIIRQYPTLKLDDVYLVIGYVLRHRPEIDVYLAEQERRADEIRAEVEKRFPPDGLKEKLLERWRKMQEEKQRQAEEQSKC